MNLPANLEIDQLPPAGSAPTLREIFASDDPIDPRPRAIYVATGMSIDVENPDGSVLKEMRVYPARLLPFVPFKIIGGNCTMLIGIYDAGEASPPAASTAAAEG